MPFPSPCSLALFTSWENQFVIDRSAERRVGFHTDAVLLYSHGDGRTSHPCQSTQIFGLVNAVWRLKSSSIVLIVLICSLFFYGYCYILYMYTRVHMFILFPVETGSCGGTYFVTDVISTFGRFGREQVILKFHVSNVCQLLSLCFV